MSRDVKFFENIFPYLDTVATNFVPENIQQEMGINTDFSELIFDSDEDRPAATGCGTYCPAATAAG